jgi:hypothetical protein
MSWEILKFVRSELSFYYLSHAVGLFSAVTRGGDYQTDCVSATRVMTTTTAACVSTSVIRRHTCVSTVGTAARVEASPSAVSSTLTASSLCRHGLCRVPTTPPESVSTLFSRQWRIHKLLLVEGAISKWI